MSIRPAVSADILPVASRPGDEACRGEYPRYCFQPNSFAPLGYAGNEGKIASGALPSLWTQADTVPLDRWKRIG